MTRLWYPISAMRRLNVVVMVRWSWWEGPASLIRYGKKKRQTHRWATVRNGVVVFLPEPGVGRDWPEQPHSFSPIEDWPDPLPKPLEEPARMDLDHSSPINTGFDPEDIKARDWWREEIPMFRSEGYLTKRSVEYRVLRALAQNTDAIKSTNPLQSKMGRDMADATNGVAMMLDEWRPAFKPSPADRSDFETAMSWFSAINPPELWREWRRPWELSLQQKTMIWRAVAVPWSFWQIAVKAGMPDEKGERHVRHLYDDGMRKCYLVAQGRNPFRGLVPRDQIAELRGRNKEWKNS